MKLIFQCENCDKENDISEINGSCKNCSNNNAENFKIITTGVNLRGMSGKHTLYTVRKLLKSALNKEKIKVIEPQKSFNTRGGETATYINITNNDVYIVLPLCDVCNGELRGGVSTSSGEHYCGSCYNKLGGKTINLKLENKTSTLNPLEINLNSELNKRVVEPYIVETGIKREDIQLSKLARWVENKVEKITDRKK